MGFNDDIFALFFISRIFGTCALDIFAILQMFIECEIMKYKTTTLKMAVLY